MLILCASCCFSFVDSYLSNVSSAFAEFSKVRPVGKIGKNRAKIHFHTARRRPLKVQIVERISSLCRNEFFCKHIARKPPYGEESLVRCQYFRPLSDRDSYRHYGGYGLPFPLEAAFLSVIEHSSAHRLFDIAFCFSKIAKIRLSNRIFRQKSELSTSCCEITSSEPNNRSIRAFLRADDCVKFPIVRLGFEFERVDTKSFPSICLRVSTDIIHVRIQPHTKRKAHVPTDLSQRLESSANKLSHLLHQMIMRIVGL